MWTADRRLYLSEDGRVVDEAAPGRKTLLAAFGAEVPEQTCRRYGLGAYAEAAEAMIAEPEPTEPEPSTAETQEPSETQPHRHRYRKGGTCKCGAVKGQK